MRHDLTLQDAELILRPLTEAQIPALCALAAECAEELRYMGTLPSNPAYYEAGLEATNQMPFVIVVGGEVAGSTRYGDLRPADAGIEIGWTWLHPRHMRTGINRRMKLLLLSHAFEVMEMERVQIKTDILNTRSQRAIEKLGAVKEGVLRAHMRRSDGSMRDTVMYSVTRGEWPQVKAGLLA